MNTHFPAANHSIAVWLLACIFSLSVCTADTVRLPTTPQLHPKYRLDVRLLVGGNPTSRINVVREWSQTFQKLGHGLTIVNDNASEKTGIINTKRSVRATGLIDDRGAVRLGPHAFRRGETEKLRDYLNDLVEFGPGGPMRQRPTWGLNEDDYAAVLKLLADSVGQDLKLTSPHHSLQSLQLPTAIKVTWSTKARQSALTRTIEAESLPIADISKGTALAMVLAQYGLGFRVMNHPRGGFVAEVDVGDESSNMWPIGWRNHQPMTTALPAMYRGISVSLDDDEFEPVLATVADRVEIPWFVSRHAIAQQGVKLDQLTVSRRPGKVSPSRLLRSMAARNRLGIAPRTDEGGTIFLWCTTDEAQKTWNKRLSVSRRDPKTAKQRQLGARP